MKKENQNNRNNWKQYFGKLFNWNGKFKPRLKMDYWNLFKNYFDILIFIRFN